MWTTMEATMTDGEGNVKEELRVRVGPRHQMRDCGRGTASPNGQPNVPLAYPRPTTPTLPAQTLNWIPRQWDLVRRRRPSHTSRKLAGLTFFAQGMLCLPASSLCLRDNREA
ncbi:hypothetical protein KC19_VG032900 [Ceratodon purpureus]|uniref:Uncharacterized protein n=1 Tax=Ceratodon purpureus TaxID=3225 RepID=A0A8T0HLL2_CERPU|nr:hypothetical protein KC19_VG032900 [Ceratodon purpureus]